jgi:hypothetical protein
LHAGSQTAASERYSLLLLLGIYAGFKSGMQNPAKIVQEIRALEGLSKPAATKPAAPFTRKDSPLRGLMHKHHLADGLRSHALNLMYEIEANGIPLLKERIAAAQEAKEPSYVTAADTWAISMDASHGSWLRRSDRQGLTGEWIVYAEHEGRNYYLCLAHHQDGDTHVRSQIDALCCYEFPFLTSLLAPQS